MFLSLNLVSVEILLLASEILSTNHLEIAVVSIGRSILPFSLQKFFFFMKRGLNL